MTPGVLRVPQCENSSQDYSWCNYMQDKSLTYIFSRPLFRKIDAYEESNFKFFLKCPHVISKTWPYPTTNLQSSRWHTNGWQWYMTRGKIYTGYYERNKASLKYQDFSLNVMGQCTQIIPFQCTRIIPFYPIITKTPYILLNKIISCCWSWFFGHSKWVVGSIFSQLSLQLDRLDTSTYSLNGASYHYKFKSDHVTSIIK